ncbi:hypothetical protein FRC11_004364 [Ceratobasidium sp. 423]|nr:hypothetical protein FRC11_004364 [Ceratobasidium sp. 423]
MSYPNNSRRQSPGEGNNRGRSRPNTPYAPLSQPQTNDYLNYSTTDQSDTFGAHPGTGVVPWPYTTPEYGWPAVLPAEYVAAEYPAYPQPGAAASYHQPQPQPPFLSQSDLYAGRMSTDEYWSGVASGIHGHDPTPSPPPGTLDPRTLQNPSAQTSGTRTRRRRSPRRSQAASSSAATLDPPYRVGGHMVGTTNGHALITTRKPNADFVVVDKADTIHFCDI